MAFGTCATIEIQPGCTPWPAADFAALYQQRWRIKEAFRPLKCRLKLEQFGGETPQAIRQEFHAAILLHNLAIVAAQDVLTQQGLDAATQVPNLTHATHLVRLYLPQLQADPASIDRIGPALLDGIAGQISKRRPDKPAPPRKPNRKKPCHHRAYKLAPVLCCWLIFATVAWRSGMLFDPQRPALTPPAASIPLPPAPSARRTTPTSGRPEC